MKEKDIRTLHRNLGIIVALFVIIQAGSGLLITLDEIKSPHGHAAAGSLQERDTGYNQNALTLQSSLAAIHHGGGLIGTWYRIVLSIGLIAMALSGGLIYLKIYQRTKKVHKR